MNSLLKRQLKKLLGPSDPIPSEWQRFVEGVGQAYDQFDDDRNMLERSLDLSSAELVGANSQLQAILETFPDLFFLTDGSGRILEQKNADKNAGYSSVENPVGTLIQDIHSAPANVLFQQAIAHVSERREPASIEYSLRIRAALEYYEARLLPLRGDRILFIIRNISVRRSAEQVIQKAQFELEEKVAERTAELRAANELLQREIGERKQIEKELKQANALTGAILDSMGDGVVVANVGGEFLLFNPAAEAILGVGFTHGDPCHWSEKYGFYLPDQVTPYPVAEMPLVKAMHGESSDGVEMFVRNPQRPTAFG
jgi:PAS domain-containing protein